MITLTAPDDTPVQVNPAYITSFYPNDGTYHNNARTILVIGGDRQAVKEDFQTVTDMLAV